MIKYLGSKRLLVPEIMSAAKQLTPTGSFLDLFSGTSRVGIAAKKAGYDVYSNDYTNYAYQIAKCYIEADLYDMQGKAENLIYDLNRVRPSRSPGFFTKTYSKESRFFKAKNTRKIEAVRSKLEHVKDPVLKAIGITSLLEAADRVDSTCGVQMAYLKKWATRADKELELRVPKLIPGSGVVTNLDAKECLDLSSDIDITYMDPPYNQHSYLGNYHIWETISLWDAPEVYGVAKKRVEVKTKVSSWNRKMKVAAEFEETLQKVKSHFIIVSFSNKAFLSKDFVLENLSRYFDVSIREIKHPSYIGTKIGRYTASGAPRLSRAEKEGVLEYLFLGSRK